MNKLNEKIQKMRAIIAQEDLKYYKYVVDGIAKFIETPRCIISVIGARSSGKAAVVNAILKENVLLSQIFKPKVIYNITNSEYNKYYVQSSSNEVKQISSVKEVENVVREEYGATIKVELKNDFLKRGVEIRTGFDTNERCPVIDYLLSDVIIFCVRATALFSIEDLLVLSDLQKLSHKKILLCITHVNMVKKADMPLVVKRVEGKRNGLPVVYFSDEIIENLDSQLNIKYGNEKLLNEIESLITNCEENDYRLNVANSALENLINDCITDLDDSKKDLIIQKDEKYISYLAKENEMKFRLLGWGDIKVNYKRRECSCIETILSELNRYKSKLAEQFQLQISQVPSPKDWWEKNFPILLKNSIDEITTSIDQKIQSQIIQDLSWLNSEIQFKFGQTSISINNSMGGMEVDYTFNQNSKLFKNLRAARYITMAGGATLSTALFFVVGPVGAIASATCGIIGDRYINKAIEEQKNTLMQKVNDAIDEVYMKMHSLIPDRVSALYTEFANALAEKEQNWQEKYMPTEFICEEDEKMKKIDQVINLMISLKK